MLSRSSVSEVPKERIYRLKAGPKRNYYYFVGISENAESEVFKDIMHIKLLSQMGTQINVFPEGYESFRTSYHRKAVDLSLQTMTIPVPVLKLGLTGWPNSSQTPRIDLIRKAASA